MNSKFNLYMMILGTSITLASTYIVFMRLILGIPLTPLQISLFAVSWYITIKYDYVLKELIEKYKDKWKK